jgi:hypothetical protein
MIRAPVISLFLILLLPAFAEADWIFKALAGMSFGTSHGFVDLEQTSGKSKPFFGAAVGWQPNDLAIEVEFATAPRFLRGDGGLVERGALTSVMGNVTWLLPRPRPGARFRGYVSGGIGVIRVALDDALDAFSSRSQLTAANAGGGVIVRVTPRAQLNGEIRYFKSQVGEQNQAGFGEEFVSYARISGGIVFRF